MRRTKHHLGDKIVNYAGTEKQRELFGHKILSIALTEPGAGSDPSMIRGSARYDAATDEWILNAEKIYCSAFGASDGAVALVRGPEDRGIRPFMAFVVEKGTPGLTQLGQVKKMGIRSWDTVDFVLQDCRLPAINKLDVDFKKTMIVFNGTPLWRETFRRSSHMPGYFMFLGSPTIGLGPSPSQMPTKLCLSNI